MSRLTVPGFSGVVRITAPQRLEDHQAQTAIDCDFRSGDLRPYYGDKQSETFGGTYTPAPVANSLFLYDQSKLVTAGGDKSFARSPVFFSDNSNDGRMFCSDNDVDLRPLAVSTVPTGVSSLDNVVPPGVSSLTSKWLGVPRPAAIVETSSSNEDLLASVEQSGSITSLQINTRMATSTRKEFDSRFTFAAGAALKTGDNVLVDIPGMAPGPYRLESDGENRVIMRRSGNPWVVMDAPLKLNKDKEPDNTIIKFTKTAHGLQPGDQVVVNYNTTAQITDTTDIHGIVRWRVYTVADATANTFILQYPDSGGTLVALRHTRTAANDGFQLRVARIAAETHALPNNGATGVTFAWRAKVGSEPFRTNYVLTYTPDENTTAQWSYANTIDVVTDRSYCITFVNEFGDESEPSLPTKTLTVVPGSPVTFKTGSILASAPANYATPTKVRLYRTDALGTFRLVTTEVETTDKIDYATLATANPVYEDTKLDAELGEPLSTQGWSVPVAGLKGLVNCPNGVVAGFRGRTIFGSVPYAPYAWPLTNQVATDYDVVGLVPTSAGLVVVTKGMPSILIGDNPSNWSMQKLEYPQGCVARRSIVDMGEFAMYASPDGLVAIAGANVEILTKSIMTREQWQAYNPATLIAAQVEGRYIASYVSGGTRKGFIYDPQTQSFTDLTLDAVAFTNDLLNDVLLMWGTDGKIYEWNQDTTGFKPYHWISKWFQLPVPEIMGVAQIFTTTTNLTGKTLKMTLWGYDNNQIVKIYEISTTSSPDAILGNRPFRLPYVAPGRFSAFEVELEGSIPVGTVMVGRTMDELKEAP